MALQAGRYYLVICDDFKMAKKILSAEEWAGRVDENPMWYERSFGKHLGLFVSNGAGWREMRKFVHKTLTKYGYGRTRILDLYLEEEIGSFFKYLDKKRDEGGNVVCMQTLFNVTVLNNLWAMVGGTRFPYDTEKIKRLTGLIDEFSATMNPRMLTFMAFPWLRFIPGATEFQIRNATHHKLQAYFRECLEERRAMGKYKETQEDLMDTFLMEIDKHREASADPNHYTDEQFIMVCLDLFITGFITTASSLEYLVMFMILNPEIQRKCHEEIDQVVGHHRLPSMNDNERMPYTQATAMEVLRRATFIPVTVRSADRDTTIDGCFVPKGSIVAVNIMYIHNNPDVWDKPEEFRPERFLDENGRIISEEITMPFGAGKRICPAEVLARISSFTYFAYLLQRYTFENPPGHPLPDPYPEVGIANVPKKFHALIKRRNVN
jgi:cytochrome P450